MSYYGSTEDKWCIIFRENDQAVMANADQMQTYFRDWRSWLNLMASSMLGEPAAMTIYRPDGQANDCKVIPASKKTPRSTYANPFGVPERSTDPAL